MAHVKTPRTAGTKVGVTRRAVLEAALALVDTEGAAKLSMRRLALDLDIEAQSIYNHIRDKQDLIDGVVDLLFEDLIGFPDDWGWEQRLAGHLRRVRGRFVEHPHGYDLVLQASTSTRGLQLATVQLLGILELAGVTGRSQRQAFVTITSTLDGIIIGERFRARMDAVPADPDGSQELLPQFFADLEQDGIDGHVDEMIARLRDVVADLATSP